MTQRKVLLLLSVLCSYFMMLHVFRTRYNLNVNFDKITTSTKLRDILKCEDENVNFKVYQRGDYLVLMNYVKAERTFACHESITYTTHCDYTFLDNVPILVERWRGPISIALFAPAEDFQPTVDSIAYLRNCASPLIKEYVTFHIFFQTGHFPNQKKIMEYKDEFDCEEDVPYANAERESLYKEMHNLTYPINVARNIARQSATTHFVFATDIELYPTLNFIGKFMQMIIDNPQYQNRTTPIVYALPVFEIIKTETIPENKTKLQEMIKSHRAYVFHRRLCIKCHLIPKYRHWLAMPENDNIHAFTIAKRHDYFLAWEAFYVGTKSDPIYDERLSWEGERNKMTQAYSMCLLDYDYMVLDNTFLVHKPGIKQIKEQDLKYMELVLTVRDFVRNTIKEELISIYGNRSKCFL